MEKLRNELQRVRSKKCNAADISAKLRASGVFVSEGRVRQLWNWKPGDSSCMEQTYDAIMKVTKKMSDGGWSA